MDLEMKKDLSRIERQFGFWHDEFLFEGIRWNGQ